MSQTDDIKQEAINLGFDLVGVTDASPLDSSHIERLKVWLSAGCAAQMTYMQRNFGKRINPGRLLEDAKSIVCVALNYHRQKRKAGQTDSASSQGRVANYAQFEDYHPFMKNLLRSLADFITKAAPTTPTFKICVDSVPIVERAFAQRAGLGFIGKNHMLINPRTGPEILLGEIITDIKLDPDKPMTTQCAACNKCIDACPTAALTPDKPLDVRKCISYLTIEHKGEIAPDLAEKISDRIFGCDNCILACPYYENAPWRKNKSFEHHPERAALEPNEILILSETDFNLRFANSPIKRASLKTLKRNANICLSNADQRI